MTTELYIWIPNWDGPEGFQHYKGRDPIWIKNYVRLLSHDEYAALSMHTRGVLHGIWMAYARSARRLPGDTLTLTRRLGQKVFKRDLDTLNHARFIELVASTTLEQRLQAASTMLALTRADDRSQEGEREREEPNPPSLPTEASYDENGWAGGNEHEWGPDPDDPLLSPILDPANYPVFGEIE